MSLEEKRWWSYAAITLVVPATYFAVILPQAASTPVDEIAFQVPLLIAGGAGVLLAVLTRVVLRMASAGTSPQGTVLKDQRDRDIHRLGEYGAGIVLAVAMAVPLGLAMLKVDQYWIANAMFVAFALSAFTGSIAKLVIYRRGF